MAEMAEMVDMTDEMNEHGRCSIMELILQPTITKLWEERHLSSDLTLKSSDNEAIPVHRSILASRSPVFKKLLYGSFSESQQLEVKLGFQSDVLKDIVQYCYTDKPTNLMHDLESNRIHKCKSLMEVQLAADYFGLPKLCKLISSFIISQIQNNPTLCWQFIDDNCNDTEIKQEVWKVIRNNLKGIIDIGGAPLLLSPAVLETILGDDNVDAEEIDMFRLIVWWYESNSCNSNFEVTEKDKLLFARQLFETYIDLDRILPRDLVSVVEPSNLVPHSALLKKYKHYAIMAQDGTNLLPITLTSHGSCWETGTRIYTSKAAQWGTTLLKTPRSMNKGIHTWSMQVLECCHSVSVGVARIDPTCRDNYITVDRNKCLGHQKCGWEYDCRGSAYHAVEEDNKSINNGFPTFGKGDIITLTLDLTETGVLIGAIGHDPIPHVLFKDMLLDERGTKRDFSFTPAVSLEAPGKVKFLGFNWDS